MATKKQIERGHLEVVRREVNDFPTGTIQDTERPDFLVCSKGPVLGVEITRIYLDGHPPPKSQDAEHDLVVAQTQALAEDRGVCPLLVDVYFDSCLTIAKRDRDSIARSLVDLVVGHLPEMDEHPVLENGYPLTEEFPKQVKVVSMWRPKSLTSHLWQAACPGIVNEDFARQLQQTIKEKSRHIPVYRKRCGKCWLVVVADWLGPSASFEISDRMSGETYQTEFDRVYFLEDYSERVVRLKTGR